MSRNLNVEQELSEWTSQFQEQGLHFDLLSEKEKNNALQNMALLFCHMDHTNVHSMDLFQKLLNAMPDHKHRDMLLLRITNLMNESKNTITSMLGYDRIKQPRL